MRFRALPPYRFPLHRALQAGALAGVLAGASLVVACAPMAHKSVMSEGAPAVSAEPVGIEHDLMLKLLSAQFALQDSDLEGGAQAYCDAAELSPDAQIAEEATRLALAVKKWPLAQRALARWQQLAPRDSGIVQAQAWIALGENRLDEARAHLDELAARGDEQAWRQIAQTLLGADDKAAAAQLLERLATPQRLAEKETNWVAMSQLAFKLGDKTLSQKLADASVERFHGSDSYAWSARLALERGDKDGARARYAEALRHDPKNPRLRGGFAALLADAGDNAAAARALATGPQDDTTYGARAAYAARGDDKAALAALYRELVGDKSARSGKRLYLMGQVAELVDKRDDALQWYRGVGDDDERWFDAQMRQAVLLDQLGRGGQGVDLLHQLQTDSEDDSERLGDAYLLEAELLRKPHPRDAIAVYARALTRLPDDARILYARALLAVEQGDAAGGERDLRRVIELKPDDAEAINALGYTIADSSRKGDTRLEEARTLIRRAIELKPNEPSIIDSLGWLHYRLGDLDASLTQLRRAYQKQPDADIAAHLGEVLWVKGDRDEARRVWDEGRRKDPKNKSLLEAIQRLTT